MEAVKYIHQVCYSICTNDDTLLVLFSKIFPDSLHVFVVTICNVFHCQIAADFFLILPWHFTEFLPTNHVFVWISTFSQYWTKYVEVSITECRSVSKSLGWILSISFFKIFVAVNTLFGYIILKVRPTVFEFVFVKSFGTIISQT